MKNNHSLEEERQAILQRMQESRQHYRHMLRDQPEVHVNPNHPQGWHAAYAVAEDEFPRSKTLRWIAQHPFMCAAAVVALVAVVPGRRLARRARANGSNGNAATAFTARSTSNIEALARILGAVASVVQHFPARPRR